MDKDSKNRERWRTLVEGYFLQRKDTAQNRIGYMCRNFSCVVTVRVLAGECKRRRKDILGKGKAELA